MEEFERVSAILRAELNDEPFFGPFVVRNSLSGNVGQDLKHTGYSLSVATATHKIDAWILERRHSLTYSQLFVLREQVRFSFHYFNAPVVDLLELLESIARIRDKRLDVPCVVSDLRPVLSRLGGSPLKRNACDCLAAEYAALGFACAPAKLQKDSAVMRVVWIYPENWSKRSASHYLPVGTLRFPIDEAGNLEKGVLDLPGWNRFLWRLGEAFPTDNRTDAWQVLSEIGRAELLTLLKSKKEGGHARTKAFARRLELVAAHRELWDTPQELARLMQQAGLYSEKASMPQLANQVEGLIWRVKNREQSPNQPTE